MRHIIYDLDGTLADTREGIIMGIHRALESQSFEICTQRSKIKIGPSITRMLAEICPAASAEEINQMHIVFRNYYDREGWKLSCLYDQVPAVLKHFDDSEIIQYIVTNKPTYPTTQIIESKQITRYFKRLISPDYYNLSFTSKTEMLSWLMKEEKLTEDETCYVGDTLGDAQAAYQCGIKFVGVSYGYGEFSEMKEKTPTDYISHFSELIDYIHNWNCSNK